MVNSTDKSRIARIKSNKMHEIFFANYLLDRNLKQNLRFIIGINLLLFLFLVVFKPYGLGKFGISRLIKIGSGFGLTCFLVLGLNSIFLPRIFPMLFKSWKVYKQVLWLFWQVSTVALANLFYTHQFGAVPLNFKALLHSEVIALTFALIPISIGIRSFQSHILKQNIKDYQTRFKDLNNDDCIQNRIVTILDENQKKKLNIFINDLLFITSADNYVEIYWKKEHTIEKTLLRSSLKRLEEFFCDYPVIFRCHRAFIVNLRNVQSVNGNSVGYKIVLQNIEKNIPVSRSYAKKLRERMRSNC